MMKPMLLAAAALLALAVPSRAQDPGWPMRAVTVIVPFGAGGPTDNFARIVTNDMQAKYAKPFVIENKTGAGGTIGAALAAKAEKDGYTLFVGTASTHSTAPFLYKTLRYDPDKDFQPIGLIANTPNLLVVANKVPAKTVPEFIAYAKANPGKLNVGSVGIGSSQHLAAELFQSMAGVQFNHTPFKTSTEIIAAIIGGDVDLAFDNITSAMPQAKAGTMRALGVTGPERSPAAPEIPAIAETLPGYDAQTWHALFAPAGTPQPIIDQVSADIRRIITLPAIEARLKEIGALPAILTPQECAAFVASEREKMRGIVAKAGITPQ